MVYFYTYRTTNNNNPTVTYVRSEEMSKIAIEGIQQLKNEEAVDVRIGPIASIFILKTILSTIILLYYSISFFLGYFCPIHLV